MHRDFKGVWIPKELWLNDNLSILEKVLLVEIDSLNKGDGCFASNEYLSKFMKISESRLAHILVDLKKRDFLRNTSFDGRKRFLSLNPMLKTASLSYGKQQGSIAESSIDEGEISQNEPYVEPRNQGLSSPSNTVSNTYSSVLSKESTESVEEPPEEDLCLKRFGFPLPEGYTLDSEADDDRTFYFLVNDSGDRVKSVEVTKLKRAYLTRKRLQTPLKSQNINKDAIMADRILKKYSELCQQEVGVTPKYGYKEKMAFMQAVKRYGAESFAKVCIWYVQSEAKDEDKINPLMCTWTRTLNNYQLDTGNKL